jgi:Domain of unknown function (DUF1918)
MREDVMHAHVHDQITVLAPNVLQSKREGEILEVHGADGAPPYLVRWSDNGHEALFFPGSDALIHHSEPDVGDAQPEGHLHLAEGTPSPTGHLHAAQGHVADPAEET